MHRDRQTGITGIALGLLIIFFTSQLPPSNVPDDIGPKVFPYFSAAIMLITGTILATKRGRADGRKQPPFFIKDEAKRFLILLCAFILYAVLLWAVGFLIATPIIMFIVSTLFSAGKKISIWKRILVALVVTVLIYIIFNILLALMLPVGKLIKFTL